MLWLLAAPAAARVPTWRVMVVAVVIIVFSLKELNISKKTYLRPEMRTRLEPCCGHHHRRHRCGSYDVEVVVVVVVAAAICGHRLNELNISKYKKE